MVASVATVATLLMASVGPASTAEAAAHRHARAVATVSLRVADLNARFDKVTNAQFTGELNVLDAQQPDVILLQETRHRLTPMKAWAKKHGYHLYAPGSGSSPHHESSVLYKRNGRFLLKKQMIRIGSHAVRRASGHVIAARYIATVWLYDTEAHRKLAFASTHALPEVQTWPPAEVRPRKGSRTLPQFEVHMRAIRAQEHHDLANRYVTILGSDLNTDPLYETAWSGFPTDSFGDVMVSNHEALGRITTYPPDAPGQDRRALDYVWTDRGTRATFTAQQTIHVVSDHDALITDLAVKVAS